MKQWRLVKGLTVEQMAKACGVSANTYSAWEANPGKVKIDNAVKVARALGESIEDIFLSAKRQNVESRKEETMNKITAIIKRPGEDAELATIENELHQLQELVGGYIECVTIEPGLIAVVDEEGIINSKPFNMKLGVHQLFGTIVFVGVDGEEFTNCPTTVWKYL